MSARQCNTSRVSKLHTFTPLDNTKCSFEACVATVNSFGSGLATWAALGACTHHGAPPSDCVPCVAWTKQSCRGCHAAGRNGVRGTHCAGTHQHGRECHFAVDRQGRGFPVGRIPQSHITTQLQKVSMAVTRSQPTFHVSDLQNFRQTPPHIPCHVRRRTLQ